MPLFEGRSNRSESELPEDDGRWEGAAPGFYYDATHVSEDYYRRIVGRIQSQGENAVVTTSEGDMEVYANGRYVTRTKNNLEVSKIYDRAVR